MSSYAEEQDLVYTLPDIQPNTHIVGILGVPREDCAPGKDSWLISDFLLFNHAFRGLGRSRHWYSSIEPQYIVDKHQRLLHGNSQHARRVVLDEKVRPTDYHVFDDEAELLSDFMNELRKICDTANKAAEPVLLILCGHGDDQNSSVYVGKRGALKHNHPALGLTHIRNICKTRPQLKMSIISTACYGQCWSEVKNITSVTASYKDPSSSRDESPSIGRFDGGIFTSVFMSVVEENTQIDFQQWAETMKGRLRELDTCAESQEFVFSPKDNDWRAEYHERTGIPSSEYSQRLSALPYWPASSPLPTSGRTPDATIAQLSQVDVDSGSRAWQVLMRRTAGSRSGRDRVLLEMALSYERSHPGAASVPYNHVISSLIRKCKENTIVEEEQMELLETLLFRRGLAKLAAALLIVMDFGPFEEFSQWDYWTWRAEHKDFPNDSNISRAIGRIIPKPSTGDEGRMWDKPLQYLKCACAAKGLTLEEVEARLELAKAWIKEQALKQLDLACGIETRGRTQKSTLFKTAGVTIARSMRSLSPVKLGKRLSRG